MVFVIIAKNNKKIKSFNKSYDHLMYDLNYILKTNLLNIYYYNSNIDYNINTNNYIIFKDNNNTIIKLRFNNYNQINRFINDLNFRLEYHLKKLYKNNDLYFYNKYYNNTIFNNKIVNKKLYKKFIFNFLINKDPNKKVVLNDYLFNLRSNIIKTF